MSIVDEGGELTIGVHGEMEGTLDLSVIAATLADKPEFLYARHLELRAFLTAGVKKK